MSADVFDQSGGALIGAGRSAPTVPVPRGMSDSVMSNIVGCRDAQHLIFTVRQGCAPADTLLGAFKQVHATGDADRLRGFCREVQKVLERTGGAVA